MHKVSVFFVGVLAVIVIALAAVGVFVLGARGFSARERPSVLERWVARRVRGMAAPTGASDLINPAPNSPEVLAAARAHWADHCAGCHANNGSGDTEMGKRMYPPAPDMRQAETQQMTDGELFFIIQNGIRMTGMPAWSSGETPQAQQRDAEDSWKLVRFIRHLPRVTAEEEHEMQGLNPKSPDEIEEEQEEKQFLNGEEPHEHPEHEHHHH
ncbi:MAG TPA: c-type cytochrome [Bryobacteraceae bacterium]|nr:c-type cytochrome [Bryobacteraceae bacterium]